LAAQAALAEFDLRTASSRLRESEALLGRLTPGPDASPVWAELAVLTGVLRESENKPTEALDAFVLARRLDPERTTLDRETYRPKVVALYEQAGRPHAGARAQLAVEANPPGAAVWLDGQQMGDAPIKLTELLPGPHVLAVHALGHRPLYETLHLDAGAVTSRTLLLERMAPSDQARELRARFMREPPADWEAAAGTLARLASVDRLIVLRQGARGVEAAVYDVATGKLSRWLTVAGTARSVVGLVLALDRPAPTPLVVRSPPLPAPRPWYRTWWGMGAVAGGLAAVTTVLALTLSGRETSYTVGRWCVENNCAP
jgi:hypothetical protein